MPKTWFQHDMNSTQKDGLSSLISKGGFSAYGRFWALMELFYSMQINHDEFKTTIKINENTLLKQLQMNRRSLPKLLQLFHETLEIVFEKNCGTFGIVYKTTAPNSLIYIRNRKKKTIEVELNIDKEKKKDIEPNKIEEKKPISDFDIAFNHFRDMRKKIKKPMTPRAEELILIELNKIAPDDTAKQIRILNQSTMNDWQGVFPLKSEKKYGVK